MSQGRRYRIGFLGSVAIACAFLAFLYASTFKTSMQMSVIIEVLIGIAGVVLASTMVKLYFAPFDLSRFMQDAMWTAICVVAIYVVNSMAPVNIATEPLPLKVFLIMAGVAEELFFRLWLCTWFHKVTGSQFMAVLVSALMWSIYHINRYGQSLNNLLVIFGAGMVLGYAMLLSRSGDGPIFAHGIVNYLA